MLDTETLRETVRRARDGAASLATTSTATKNTVLTRLAELLAERIGAIVAANEIDMVAATASGMDRAMLDRLHLTHERVMGMASDVRHVVTLPDPIGEEFDGRVLPNGLSIRRRRVPLGVIAVIYESRPNVTIDVAALCLKSGNAVVLRGGKEALRSNSILADCVRDALEAENGPVEAVQFVRDTDRALIGEMLGMRGEIDLIVPRGGARLIEYVRENAQVPVVAGGVGVCHTYVHADADVAMAVEIVDNAKTRRPSVCNALDTVLVHEAIAERFLPVLARRWTTNPVEMRCDPRALSVLHEAEATGFVVPADPDDFGQEFLALRAAIRVVDSFDEAVTHIGQYGSGHSEAIVTDSYSAATDFLNAIDAAAVFVNASTGFTDGSQFGLGAELGISTQKFHARGPVGLRELTSYKWVVEGSGQIRE
jgi:glutamate-5-semialdehyde dehydrogenase